MTDQPVHIRPALAELPAYVPGRAVPGGIKLSSNEIGQPPSPAVLAAVAKAAADANRYPDNGTAALVAELARRLVVDERSILVGNGSVSLLQDLVLTTCDPGDEVVYPWRSFEAYPIVIQVGGAQPVPVPLDAEYAHDLPAMAAAITARTRMVFLCNPNNPTGRALGRAELERFLDAVPERVLVVLDEAYFEYNRWPTPDESTDGLEFVASRPNVIVLRTFSKAYGLAGLRVGYAVGNPALVDEMRKVHTPFGVSSVAQAAALAALSEADTLMARTDEVIAERTRMRTALIAAGYVVPESHANFVYLPLGERTQAFASAAADAGIIIRAYGVDGARITLGTPAENDAFLAFAAGWR